MLYNIFNANKIFLVKKIRNEIFSVLKISVLKKISLTNYVTHYCVIINYFWQLWPIDFAYLVRFEVVLTFATWSCKSKKINTSFLARSHNLSNNNF